MRELFRFGRAALPPSSVSAPRAGWAWLAVLGLSLSAGAAHAQTNVISRFPDRNQLNTTSPLGLSMEFRRRLNPATIPNLRVFSAQANGQLVNSGNTSRGLTDGIIVGTYTGRKPGETIAVTVPPTIRNAANSPVVPEVWQFTTATGGTGRGTFGGGSEVAVGTWPRSVAAADVDGDGDLDLLAANYGDFGSGGNTVSVRLNDGTGAFSGAQDVAVGGEPAGVVAADVDADGDLDLLTANEGSASISVRLNDGAGTFSGAQDVAVAGRPTAVAVGDVDADGDLDLVASLEVRAGPNVSAGVSVCLNDGAGTFSETQNLDLGSDDFATDIAAGDVDADGDLDFVTATRQSNAVSVGLNDGTGTFSLAPAVPVGAFPTDVAVADVDGDGDLDLLAANSSGASVSVRLNDGAGTFSGTQDVAVAGFPLKVTTGDVDADGDLDLLATSSSSNAVSVRLNDGTGTFSGAQDVSVGSDPRGLAVADLDNDGDLDILAANQLSNAVSVRFNLPPAPVLTSVSPTSGAVGSSVQLTGTHFDDVTAITFNGTNAPSYTFASGTLLLATVPAGATTGPVTVTTPSGTSNGVNFTVTPPLLVTARTPARNSVTNNAPAGLILLDFNADVAPSTANDVRAFSAQRGGQLVRGGNASALGATIGISNNAFKPGETVFVTVPATVQSTSGVAAMPHVYQFTAKTAAAPGTFSGGSDVAMGDLPYGLTAGDVDGDGDLDLLSANYGSGTVSVRLNNGSGTFSGTTTVPVGNSPTSVVLADIDGDGDLDMLVSNLLGGTVSVRRNNGSGTFSGTDEVPAGTPEKMAMGDIDGDGDLDLVTTNRFGSTVSVRVNDGAGAFSGAQEVDYSLNLFGVALGDVDNDGDLDLITARSGRTASVGVRLNDGTGTFGAGTDLATNINAYDVTVGDVDGDGDLDLVFPESDRGNVVVVRLNDGTGTTFSAGTDLTVDSEPTGVTLSDIDGDGDLDLLVDYAFGNNLNIRLNDGTGTFSGSQNLALANFGTRAALADVDGDGDVDLLAASRGAGAVSVRFNQLTDLVVSTPQTVPAGPYGSITVTSTGRAFLEGDVQVSNALVVQSGGFFDTNQHLVTGPGSFTLQADAELTVGHQDGITASGPTGSIRVSGARSFSPQASYYYNMRFPSAPLLDQYTGNGLPGTVRQLGVNAYGCFFGECDPYPLHLTNDVRIERVLRLDGSPLALDGHLLTLLSTATHTAYVVHNGDGRLDEPVTVQRYIGGPLAGGYRHLSSPVQAAPVSDLTTPGFVPKVNPAYNALPYVALPAAQFPNIYGFDETRGGTTPAFAGFSTGYFSPATLGTTLTPGRGYTVFIPGAQTPDFVGILTTGDVSQLLTATGPNPSPNTLKAGWGLLGNPYAQPIDWDLATVPTGMSGSISVFRTQGGNNGQYLTRQNGMGSLPNGELPLGQGFFARATSATTFTFTNVMRVTTNPGPVARPVADARPTVRLTLASTAPDAVADETLIYAETGATRGEDLRFDGLRPGRNLGTVPTLASLINGQEAAVNGLPLDAITNGQTVVELTAALPTAGTYTLTAADVANLPTGTTVSLLDRQLNLTQPLTAGTAYQLTATTAGEVLAGRFALVFNANRVLSAGGVVVTPRALQVYPNPASAQNGVQVTGAVVGTRLTLFDALGRAIAHATADTTGATSLPLRGLAAGVYTLRTPDGRTARLVVE